MRDPHARNLRSHRILGDDVVYSVTTTTRERGAVLDAQAAERIVETLAWVRAEHRALLFGFVVMPDHLHLLVMPLGKTLLPALMKSIKGFSSRQIKDRCSDGGPLWQPGYFDHAIRTPAEAWTAKRYIEENPVRAGLAIEAEEYSFSSAHPSRHVIVDPLW